MQQYTEGQKLRGSDGNTYIVVNGVPSLPADLPNKFGGVDPSKQYADENQQIKRETAARAAVAAENANRNSAAANSLAERKFAYEQSRRNDAPLTAKDRADAIVEYNKAIQLRSTIDDLIGKYRAGPGATSGPMGVADFLPTQNNAAFDSAANKLRGSVKAAQGFTGGEGNTMGEVKMNIGPFIPSSWEYDQTTEDKLSELYNQSDNAVQRTVALLGGVPDQYGNVVQEPASKANRMPFDAPPAEQQRNDDPMAAAMGGQPPQGPQGPRMPPMIGGLPQGSDIEFGFAKQDGGFDRNAWLQSNYGITPNQEASVTAFMKANRGNPNFSYDDLAGYYNAIGLNPPQESPETIAAIRSGNVNVTGYDSTQAEAEYKAALAQRVQERDTSMGAVDTTGRMAANALFGAGDRVSAGLDTLTGEGSYSENLARQRFESDAAREANPLAALGGDVAGVIGGTVGTGRFANSVATRFMPALARQGAPGSSFARNVLNDTAYGAAYGATEQGNPVSGALTAGLGSAGGQFIGGAIQRGVTGITDEGVQYLSKRGIPLSLGEMLGQNSAIGRRMQSLEALPFLGDMMHGRRGEAKDAVFNAVLDDAVETSGQKVTGQGVDALISAQGIKNQAYDDAYTNINAPIDAQYLQDVAPGIRTGRGIYGEQGKEFYSVVRDELRPLFGPNRSLDGESAQQFGQSINEFAADFGGRGAYGKKAAKNLKSIGDATQDLIGRTNPLALPKMQSANTINARLTPIEMAMNTAKDIPTPKQLRAAYTNNTKNYGGRSAAARGDKVPDVIKYASENAPTIGTSGTSERLAGIAPFILPTALGGSAAGLETFSDSPGTTGLLATLAAMSTKTGQAAVQAALTRRPQSAKRLGGIFGGRKARRAIGGGITAPYLIE